MTAVCSACRAAVRPRTVSPETGEGLLLEDAVAALLERHPRGAIQIVGGPDAGKTTALEHLAAVLPTSRNVRFFDDASPNEIAAPAAIGAVVCALSPSLLLTIEELATAPYAKSFAPSPPGAVPSVDVLATLPLAAWGEDDAIEYLLARHPERCESVMGRLRASRDAWLLEGVAGLWRLVLDRMARDDWIGGARGALHYELALRMGELRIRRQVQEFCLAVVSDSCSPSEEVLEKLERLAGDPRAVRLCRHRRVQVLVASDAMVSMLNAPGSSPPDLRSWLSRPLPHDFIREVGARAEAKAAEALKSMIAGGERDCQPMAASLLHAMGIGWKPARKRLPNLCGAWLKGARWAGVDLSSAELEGADLTGADLSGARLRRAGAVAIRLAAARLVGAELSGAHLMIADLREADLSQARADGVDLSGANLQHARLEGARLREARLTAANLERAVFAGADLSGARLNGARIAGADFRDADFRSAQLQGLKLTEAELQGARFTRADLSECDLEFLHLQCPNFEQAHLRGALLTGSVLPRGRFRGADLTGTGLADIEWEGADLRNAALQGATFHMGSSRSGLLFTPIASEGTRTGFYTDDFGEQHFKAPEEIRKANLCRADLRGADVADVDFYLVDLRGARYTHEQRALRALRRDPRSRRQRTVECRLKPAQRGGWAAPPF